MGRVPLVLAHGFRVLLVPNVEVAEVGVVPKYVVSAAGVKGGEMGRSGAAQALISSLLFNSPPGPLLASDDVPPTDSLLKSFATPPYASCTTDNAAVAFDENRPHMERTPLEENRSVVAPRGEGEGRGLPLLVRGEGERGMDEELAAAPSCPRMLPALDRTLGVGRE